MPEKVVFDMKDGYYGIFIGKEESKFSDSLNIITRPVFSRSPFKRVIITDIKKSQILNIDYTSMNDENGFDLMLLVREGVITKAIKVFNTETINELNRLNEVMRLREAKTHLREKINMQDTVESVRSATNIVKTAKVDEKQERRKRPKPYVPSDLDDEN